MSHNQSRGERSESTQYKKTGRSGNSNQQRHFQGVASTKGGGGASSATSNPASRGLKKYSSNAQGGQSRARSPNVDSNVVRNGPHQQQPTQRVYDSPVASPSSNAKLTEATTQKIPQPVLKPSSNVPPPAPTSNVTAANFETGVPTTPAKGDPSKSFTLQFGSISPGFMDGVQIPARTSSAPPNLDEQKKAQARQDSLRAAPGLSIPSIPKQQLPKKDAGTPDQTNAGQAQIFSKSKRDTQVSAAPSVTQTQKPAVHSIPGMHMQLPYHQPQVPVQFGAPNPQIQSQAMSGTSLPIPMPIPLPMGSPPMQQQMFISGLQPHPIQSQGMMHPVQNFNFSTQMGHQLPPQLGSMGINIAPQFPQQQAGKHGASRKTVKITHPDTHEELRFDGSPVARSHANAPLQSQPVPSSPPNHPMNFNSNSYSANATYIQASSSVPLNSTQVPPASQPPKVHNQVTVKPPVVSRGEKDQLPITNSISIGKEDSIESSKLCGEDSVFHQKEVETSCLSSLPQLKPGLGTSSASAASSGSVNVESDMPNTSTSASAPRGGPESSLLSFADGAREGGVVPDSMKDKPDKSGSRDQQDQVSRQSTSLSSLASQSSEAELEKTKSTLSKTNLVPETAKESLSATLTISETSNFTSKGSAEGSMGDTSRSLGVEGVTSSQLEPENVGRQKQGETVLSESLRLDKHSIESSLKSLSLESSVLSGGIEHSSDQVTSCNDGLLEQTEEKLKESLDLGSEDVKTTDLLASTRTEVSGKAESSVPSAQDDKTSGSDTSLSVADSIGRRETTVIMSGLVDLDSAPILVPSPHDGTLKPEDEDIDNTGGGLVYPPPSSVKDKVSSDANVTKTAVPRAKKKKKDIIRKAEATGTSSDLYMAYKGPEEKKETVTSAESTEKASSISVKPTPAKVSQENHVAGKKPAVSKVEPDDWEDAAEISPQLETSKNENQFNDGDGIGLMTKKYSRDFLLKFAGQCPDLPEGFEITSDIADALMESNVNTLREYPSPGRNIDRPVGGYRPDRRSSSLADDDRWSKFPGPLMPGRGDMWTDVGNPGNIVGFRPSQASNYGVLRNPRAQAPVQYGAGILSGPIGPHGGLQRNYSDSDRWQRGTGFQRVLMPSPQSPQPAMHKAEKKYEVGKVADEEAAKQRQLKAILNKLTPQNFDKLFRQVKQVNVDKVVTLTGVISQIFDKALMEPTFCEMYADFCFHLAADLPDLSVENERITFKRLLLNKCQEEFERGEREEEEANKVEEEGEVKQTAEEREEKRLRARRRMLGNIRLIGELYKKRMLTERIMHECINKLLGQYQNPDEENIEALCKLMSTIGEMIDHLKAKDHMDAYFEIMAQLSNNMKLSSRVRFMLKDAIDLRKNKWQQRRKVEGPKKIEELHRDAAQERQAQASRLARAPSVGNSIRRGSPMDFAPRVPSMLSSPGSHMSGFRAGPPQLRGQGSQDVRMDDKQSFENRTISVPLPQRPLGDDSITLGPQGGLVRGMAFRGQPSSLAEMSSPADARRMGPGLNGFSSMPERTPHGQREDLMPRYMPDRFDAPSNYDQLHPQEQREVRSTDRGFDRSLSTPPRGGPPTSMPDVPSEMVWPEEHLRDKSMTAIKEFYSARDEKEVTLCIKDLNSPSFHPTMISIWLTDSFERKDMERDLLTKLLINLAKRRDGIISEDQLIKGFESALAVLEDAVNDAPRAAEFLGRLFATIILENIVSLSEIGQLIIEGGEEQGRLVEIGLGAEVMGSILDAIKSEKGDSVLNEIRSGSNLQLENFKSPGSNKSSKIDKFM